MRKDVLFAAALGTLAALAPAAQAGWTELKAARNGHFIARAMINQVPVTAMIDTGASVVAIPYEQARRMGLRPAFLRFNQPVWTANGRAFAAPVTLRRVEIDNVVARNVPAMVMPKGALRHVLIGMSFLSRLRRFEVKGKTLRLVN